MRKPKKIPKPNPPSKPFKPIKPQQFLDQEIAVTIPYGLNKLSDILNSAGYDYKSLDPESISIYYYDGDYDGNCHSVYIHLGVEKVESPYYQNQIIAYEKLRKKYEKDLARYNEKYLEYEKKLLQWETDMIPYNTWLKEQEKLAAESRIKYLEEELVKLKGQQHV